MGPPPQIMGIHHENSAPHLQQMQHIHQQYANPMVHNAPHVPHMGPYFGVAPQTALDSQQHVPLHSVLNHNHLPNTVMTTQVQQGVPQLDQSTILSQSNIPMYQPR